MFSQFISDANTIVFVQTFSGSQWQLEFLSIQIHNQYQHARRNKSWNKFRELLYDESESWKWFNKKYIDCKNNFSFGQLLLDLQPVNISLKIMEQIRVSRGSRSFWGLRSSWGSLGS